MRQKEKKRIHDEMRVFGRIVCKYKIEQDLIDDLNQKYEDALKKTNLLTSHGKNLAGRIDSELDILPILQNSANLYLKIPEFINDVTEPHKFKDGRIVFVSPNATTSESILPNVGDFYIFAADHMHAVYPFKTKDPSSIRRSMPINFIINNAFKGKEISNG